MVWELVNDLFLVSMSGLRMPASILRLQRPRPPRDSLASSFRLGAQIGDSNRINHLRALWGKNRGEGEKVGCIHGRGGIWHVAGINDLFAPPCTLFACDHLLRSREAGADELVSAVVDDDDDDAGRPLRERDSE